MSVDSIITDGVSGLMIGRQFSFSTTGLSAVTSINAKTASKPAAQTDAINIVQIAGDGSAHVKFFEPGGYMPYQGNVEVTVIGPEGPQIAVVPFSIPNDHIDVYFVDPIVTNDNTYIGHRLNAIGHPLVNGDIGYYINSNALNIGQNGSIACDQPNTFLLWVHKTSGIIEGYSITVNEAGGVTELVRYVKPRVIRGRFFKPRIINSRFI